LPQAFLDTPGILVQQTTPGHGSPYIRGFNGRQTLLLQDGSFYKGSASYQFDTNSRSHIGRVEQSLGEGQKWGVILGVSAKDVGDIKDSAVGRMRGTEYQEESFDLKFEAALSDSVTLSLAHSYLIDCIH